MGLIETKKEVIDDFLIRRLWPNLDFDYCYSSSNGASGGLLCVWNSSLISPTRIQKKDRWISLDFIWFSKPIRYILVYAHSSPFDRTNLWLELLQEIDQNVLCFLTGDFNEILDPSERAYCSSFSASMLDFADFINKAGLLEVPLNGRFFTWYNSISKSKIDRCFVTPLVLTTWQDLHLKALARSFSDHVPIFFSSVGKINWGPRPFRSINAWWEHPNFVSFIESSWQSLAVSNPNGSLVFKIRELRKLVKDWNIRIFGDLNSKAAAIQHNIEELESVIDNRELSEDESISLSALQADLYGVTKQQESLWLQKARLNWNLLGDKNTSFFHLAANIHAKNNLISEIYIDNIGYNRPVDIKLQISKYFRFYYKKKQQISFCLDQLQFRQIRQESCNSLTAYFEEEEVFNALKSCDPNKAPGPDGFNMFFYGRSWQIVKEDIMQIFNDFCSTGLFPKGLNTAFLILIPKVKGASNIKDFRPISLINGIFKLLSKVLANRLAPCLPDIISENQFGFIKGRSIHECHSIASEIINLSSRRKEQNFLIKLDFQKAFDSISWSFIMGVLRQMKFSSLWVDWISSLLSTSQLSVLINGSPSENFYMERGVRQGDPLSPMLFVIAAEGFKILIDKAKDLGLIQGIRIEDYHESLSILQFADDTLLFIPNNMEMIKNLLRILRCFELISGLRINFKKSSIIGLNVQEADLTAAANILNCKTEKLPIDYLGMPLSKNVLKISHFDHLKHNFMHHLALWKGNLLSPAGRLVLIKSVLASLHVYSMCNLAIPFSVIAYLESNMRMFLWSGSANGRGLCKVAWDTVCLPTRYGGLNIPSLHLKNQSLLLKWVWKLISCDKQSMWFLVVRDSSRLNSWHDIISTNNKSLSTMWRGIRKICANNSDIWNLFCDNVRYKVGNGEDIKFWKDIWFEGQVLPLFKSHSQLYNLSLNQDDYLNILADNEGGISELKWKRRLRVGEAHCWENLQGMFGQIRIIYDQPDRPLWCSKEVRFSSSSFCSLNLGRIDSNVSFLVCVWNKKIPPRIQFFTWLLYRERLSSNWFLFQRGLLAEDQQFCSLCTVRETGLHIVLHCSKAWVFWCIMLSRIQISGWSAPPSIDAFYFEWISLAKPKFRNLWGTIWFISVWELWKARNKRVFADTSTSYKDLVFLCISKGVIHYRYHNPSFPYSGNDVFRSLDFIFRT
ncbi:uncharacterized protein LOC126681456 [Mercurialis annua]|uniref:uncharacterized protein LOC126681456 n=1 Tax=Mercurialis annua TaxID=3986 RepID=UPI00215FA526|nr:uncharacterized protein LOC126681456 [Mercurialis annua]